MNARKLAIGNIRVNPDFDKLIPPLEGGELANLEQNILEEGIRTPIVIDGKDRIVDGHNRYRIATKYPELFAEVPVLEKHFASDSEIKLWMINEQLGRRNLNPFNRTELALQQEELLKKHAPETAEYRNAEAGSASRKTATKVAEVAGVGRDTVNKVKNLVKNGDEELLSKVRAGDISVNQAYKQNKLQATAPVVNNDLTIHPFVMNDEKGKNVFNKLHLLLGKDDLRPILSYLSFKDGCVIGSDAHILGKFSMELFAGELTDEVKQLLEGKFLSADTLKQMGKKMVTGVSKLGFHTSDGLVFGFSEPEGTYPDVGNVLNRTLGAERSNEPQSFCPKLFARACEISTALYPFDGSSMAIQFTQGNAGAIVQPHTHIGTRRATLDESLIIVMPRVIEPETLKVFDM